jgi:hypothetical protein
MALTTYSSVSISFWLAFYGMAIPYFYHIGTVDS